LITLCIRPDNAKGFLNLKRAFNALNIAHSTPGGFYMSAVHPACAGVYHKVTWLGFRS